MPVSHSSWFLSHFFHGSPKSCSSNHSQPLVQVDWWIGFWGSTFCSIYFWTCFHLCKGIESWGSMGTSNLFSSFHVDCHLFQNIHQLQQRLRYILWVRIGGTAATQLTKWPCWPWPYQSPWPCKTNWPCQPHWSHQLHWPKWSHWPCGLHQPQWPYWPCWPYRPHWPYWPNQPCWPHWMHWP